jgi:hypothetical protein
MADAQEVRWIATLSDGTTAVEHSGEWQIIPGQRKPWVRFCEFAAKNKLHLTSLRLNFKGRTIHMPRSKFDRFDMNVRNRAPLSYSLQYHIEAEMDELGAVSQQEFIDLASHYGDFTVHYVQELGVGNNSWVIVTDDDQPLAESPRNVSNTT